MVRVDTHVTIRDVIRVAKFREKVDISKETLERISRIRAKLEELVKSGAVIYGVNTGFGALVDKRIEAGELEELQLSVLRSHCAGVGNPLPEETVRGMIFLRAVSLAKGYSGVRPVVIQRLMDFLNLNIVPVVPEKGSVGASGDLAPLSHVALALVGEGEVFLEGKRIPASEALTKAGLEKLELREKEGLSLVNGTQASASLAVLNLWKARKLLDLAVVAAAMSLDALKGSTLPFDERIHMVRLHPGQLRIAKKLRELLEGSEIRASHLHCQQVQDAYTLRTIPQVYGAVLDTMDYVERVLEIEINAVTDNPLIFENGDSLTVISGGNFHGEPVALVCDYLSIALCDMMNMMERRIDRLLNPMVSRGLPPFLARGKEGLNSGYMLWQYTAASIASENKVLAHPSSADSIPTSAYQEDHVSMSMNAALKLDRILKNLELMVSIELMLASRALEAREPLKTSPILEEYKQELLSRMGAYEKDRVFQDDFQKVLEFVKDHLNSSGCKLTHNF